MRKEGISAINEGSVTLVEGVEKAENSTWYFAFANDDVMRELLIPTQLMFMSFVSWFAEKLKYYVVVPITRISFYVEG